jgi:hypothetical protein
MTTGRNHSWSITPSTPRRKAFIKSYFELALSMETSNQTTWLNSSHRPPHRTVLKTKWVGICKVFNTPKTSTGTLLFWSKRQELRRTGSGRLM